VSYNQVNKSNYNADSLKQEAVRLASRADLVIFIGGLNKNSQQDSEGDDRNSYALPFGQSDLIAELVKVNKKVVCVMLSGNAYEMPWADNTPSILQAWYLGSESGHAIANILSGDVNPSGKLPFTFGVKLTDWGSHSYGKIAYPGDGFNEVYKEDILVGYRWFDTKNIEPRFPFGYGLSYTTFTYGKAVADKKEMAEDGTITISVPVKNTGKMKGKEVVELYIADQKSTEMRPKKELKAFRKIELNPGEEKMVHFTIDKTALQFYSNIKKAWVAEPGKFTVLIGASSRDIRSKVDINLF
jgi:beta-glucosidase